MEPYQPKIQRKRIQALGETLTFKLSRLFRTLTQNRDQNMSYQDLIQELAEAMKSSFSLLKGCSLRVTPQSVHLVEKRIFIEHSMLESVQHLAGLFRRAEIGGLSFAPNFVEETDLPKNLIALANVLVKENAQGAGAVSEALAGYDCYKVTPLEPLEEETFPSTMIDERHAAKYALRNALKLMYFLEQLNESVVHEMDAQMDAAYRVILNLIRVNESYPRFIRGLLNVDIPREGIRIQFYTAILLLTVFRQLRLSRQIQLDLVVNSLYHYIGESPSSLTKPDGSGNLALRHLLHSEYIGRGFYYRVNFAYYTPRNDHPRMLLPINRFVKTVAAFVRNWRGDPSIAKTAQECVIEAMNSDLDESEKAGMLLLAKALGLAPEGSLLVHQKKDLVHVADFEDSPSWVLSLDQVRTKDEPLKRREPLHFEMSTETDRKAAMRKLSLVKTDEPGPNFTNRLFANRVF
ncbi:hypothetical protein SCOR_13565 [Sulfidibacter corallicola]|uniref:Uncharacterized protein n=1 Tax=Sulfidibacter corallicola TaxID=2818388 RepID=A0A8A4TM30_SULCO|nr:hypothetical protein [Sulfidibacter corallicola]QTD47655.1 hypothetical protein J3U87_18845 [Sulfidibacter corallicola]